MAQTDRELIQAHAQQLITIFSTPNPAGCGGKDADHCSARRALIELGWINQSDYGKKNISARSVPAIKRLQTAVGETPDGYWGPRTSGAVLRTLEEAVGQTLAISVPVVTDPVAPTPPGSPDAYANRGDVGPSEPTIGDKAKTFFAGIPWILPVGLVLAAGAGWFFYRRGKANGLSGCACGGMAGHAGHDHKEHEEDEGEEGVDSQIVESLRHIPEFRAPGAPRRRPTKVA